MTAHSLCSKTTRVFDWQSLSHENISVLPAAVPLKDRNSSAWQSRAISRVN